MCGDTSKLESEQLDVNCRSKNMPHKTLCIMLIATLFIIVQTWKQASLAGENTDQRIEINYMSVLLRISIAVKRNYDHGNSYKTFNWDGLQFRGLAHYHHGGTWRCAGRQGAGEVAESPTSYR